MAWEGEQLADISATVSNSASYPHVFDHKHISLPPLSGFYGANSRTTETPNGPTPLTPPQPRLLRGFYSLSHTVACAGGLGRPLRAASLQDACRASSALFRVYTISTICNGLPPPFSLYDSFRPATSSRTHRSTPYPQQVQSVLFGFTPRLFNYLSQRS